MSAPILKTKKELEKAQNRSKDGPCYRNCWTRFEVEESKVKG